MSKQTDINQVMERLSRWNKNINWDKPIDLIPDLKSYLDYYGFRLTDVDYHFGKIEIDETKIMVQMFAPKESKGTVFLLHGYLDHVGSLQNIIQYLSDLKYSVISYDLQGHGLSEGETASVHDFSGYHQTLEKLMKKVRDEMPNPFYVIGHSTGGAIALSYVLKNPEHRFDKVVLVAPLIRSNHWHLTKLGFHMVKHFPFIDKISRNFRKNSSNQDYLTFVKKDPLQPQAIPLEWVEALIEWNKDIQSYLPTNVNTCMIQGTKDKTVAWKYNIQFVQEKFQNLQLSKIDDGRHQLFNEKSQIRTKVFTYIQEFLNH